VTTLDLDDELTIDESPWLGRAITAFVLLLAGAFAIAAVWYFFMRSEEEAVRATEDVAVGRGTINSSVIFQGTADAQLNSSLVFQTAGKVSTVNVRIGDTVTTGQVLAQLESDDLANGVASAQANVVAAQLRLQDLREGSSSAELAAAEQSVAAADAALTKARNDYADLQDGVADADLAAAQQAVSLSESQLATAQASLNRLEDTPSEADVAAAESGVATAQSALAAARGSLIDQRRADLLRPRLAHGAFVLPRQRCTGVLWRPRDRERPARRHVA
jgi:multidrug efflux pump subunit AcrA (membrane-fusion protein)